jgi:hypothetical protein
MSEISSRDTHRVPRDESLREYKELDVVGCCLLDELHRLLDGGSLVHEDGRGMSGPDLELGLLWRHDLDVCSLSGEENVQRKPFKLWKFYYPQAS